MSTQHSVNFQGNVIEVTVTNNASVIKNWVSQIWTSNSRTQIIVGLDCEWRPNTNSSTTNKIATLQLCVANKCIIIQMLHVDYIPQLLTDFIGASNVILVGVEVQDDVLKLRNDYGIGDCTVKTADIQAMATRSFPMQQYVKPGLKTLARDVVGLHMEKPSHVCLSDWEAKVLSVEQIEYACIDAFASYKIGYKLLNN